MDQRWISSSGQLAFEAQRSAGGSTAIVPDFRDSLVLPIHSYRRLDPILVLALFSCSRIQTMYLIVREEASQLGSMVCQF